MFKFLKEKIRSAIKKISKEAEEIPKEEIISKPKKEEIILGKPELISQKSEEKKGVITKLKEKITTRKIDEKKFEDLFWDLELSLMENNVAIEVIGKIKENLKVDLVNVPLERKKIEDIIKDSLHRTVTELFKNSNFDLIENINKKEDVYIILFLGINGSGKTTTIAKIAKLLKSNNISCAMAAADTFRAAAIQQLEEHGKKIDVKVIKHDYGADAAAVAFDAIKHAKSKNIKVVLIDTAGRMHSNVNLMDELKKIARVSSPDLKIFVGESITGNDCIEQARKFNDTIGIDGVILAKADIDEKGGTLVSISYILDKPIIYLGTGQGYGDIEKFSLDKLLEKLGI